MRTDRSFILVSVIASGLAAACGGGGAGSSSSTSSESQTSAGGASASPAPSAAPAGGLLVIEPMRIHPTAENAASHVIELRADGTIAADEHVLGRIEGSRVLDPSGQVVFEVTDDGHLSVPGRGVGPEMTADGALVAPDGRIVVNADGTIEERRASGEVRPAPFRFENVPANARRTAIALVIFLTMAVQEPAEAPAQASVAPSAAPPAEAPAASPAPTSGRRGRRGH